MDCKAKSDEKVRRLIEKGINIPNPWAVDIGDEVSVERISPKDVKIFPGCRIYGEKTVISAGCRLGYEGPVTVENCFLGPQVELKGGFFSESVFLEKSNMALGAHVREGTILEEEANGAHCVGLKQTILFPFVTLGSLINFCDCLMAGGTSRKNHSEVGSSYIHFNYTPDADKTTPSMIGDVPRGVMLNQPPIFLGGQGGIVGPIRMGYGNIVAAGCILREDCLEDNQLITSAKKAGSSKKPFVPAQYPNWERVLQNNITYLANLKALEFWYTHVRKSYFEAQELGLLVYEGAMSRLSLARKERLKRLKAMAEKGIKNQQKAEHVKREAVYEGLAAVEGLFNEEAKDESTERAGEAFLSAFQKVVGKNNGDYIKDIQGLPPEVSSLGVAWLNSLVAGYCEQAFRSVHI